MMIFEGVGGFEAGDFEVIVVLVPNYQYIFAVDIDIALCGYYLLSNQDFHRISTSKSKSDIFFSSGRLKVLSGTLADQESSISVLYDHCSIPLIIRSPYSHSAKEIPIAKRDNADSSTQTRTPLAY